MRAACAVFLMTCLLATSALAGASASVGERLAPGKPAGTRQAQSVTTIGSVVLGGAVLLGAMLAIQSGGAAAVSGGTPALNAVNQAANQAATLNTAK